MSDAVSLSINPSCRDCGKTPRVTDLITVMIELDADLSGLPVFLCVAHYLRSASERGFDVMGARVAEISRPPVEQPVQQPPLSVPSAETPAVHGKKKTATRRATR